MTIILVFLSTLSSLLISFVSCIIRLAGEVSFSELEVDIALAAYNLGTKLIRWTSSINCDRVGVSSLTICQCSDEEEVFISLRGPPSSRLQPTSAVHRRVVAVIFLTVTTRRWAPPGSRSEKYHTRVKSRGLNIVD